MEGCEVSIQVTKLIKRLIKDDVACIRPSVRPALGVSEKLGKAHTSFKSLSLTLEVLVKSSRGPGYAK